MPSRTFTGNELIGLAEQGKMATRTCSAQEAIDAICEKYKVRKVTLTAKYYNRGKWGGWTRYSADLDAKRIRPPIPKDDPQHKNNSKTRQFHDYEGTVKIVNGESRESIV